MAATASQRPGVCATYGCVGLSADGLRIQSVQPSAVSFKLIPYAFGEEWLSFPLTA